MQRSEVNLRIIALKQPCVSTSGAWNAAAASWGSCGWGMAGGNVQKVVQAVVITDTSSTEPQHTGPHCMWATGCDKAAQESKVTFSKHKFSGHTAPIRRGRMET